MRRADGSGAQNYFAGGMRAAHRIVLHVFESGGAAVFEKNARRVNTGPDREIAAAQRGPQVRIGGAAAAAFFLRYAIESGAVLAIDLRDLRDAALLRGLDEGVGQRIDAHGIGDRDSRLDGLEKRNDVVVAPAGMAEVAPAVVVGTASAKVDHRVHRAASAQHFSARPIEAAAVEVLLRLGCEVPVDGRFEKLRERGGDVNLAAAVGWTGFNQQDVYLGILRQTRGDD